ncbi:MAG: hypothetical protein DCF23_04530 [Cyanobium sp.]|nr:MAG: hypothetical protein DCF23_04530 [Cyanobium sp.]
MAAVVLFEACFCAGGEPQLNLALLVLVGGPAAGAKTLTTFGAHTHLLLVWVGGSPAAGKD